MSSDLNFFHGITADHKSGCCKEILSNNAIVCMFDFLGGLSLHLNHLIA